MEQKINCFEYLMKQSPASITISIGTRAFTAGLIGAPSSTVQLFKVVHNYTTMKGSSSLLHYDERFFTIAIQQ